MVKDYKIVIVFFASISILYIIRILTIEFLKKLAQKTPTKLDDVIYKAIRLPSLLWIFIISLHITLTFLDISERHYHLSTKIINTLLILSITIFLANLSTRLLKLYMEEKNLPTTGTSLIFIIINTVIYIVGILIILSNLNVPITPIITTLGIGGLAVGLALKDTLSNIFSGLYILVEKRINIGDLIELENGKKGYVVNISWRTTTLKTLTNDTVIIPNEKLAQSVILNYAKPVNITRTSIEIPVSYDTDIDKLEKIILEEVEKYSKEDSKLFLNPEPTFRFVPGFGDSSLNFTLYVYVLDYEGGFAVQSELRKRIFKRLKAENIEIPYPQLDVHLKRQ
ncbi:mechanosensitive ion channel family protein [Sulfurihydrogenibium subterraneum]|uniref:mechanosensitive ion channel family protein n=1 Tax=Sulfurihydrogenibium subterraneum TaxID=171121 RepID=UPI00048CDE5B|nr:mechanosensitive ion channel family protein [Sulfurihydrogenibium subterraneum]